MDEIEIVCDKFFADFPDYEEIVWDGIEVVLHRPGSTEPFVAAEYRTDTQTRTVFDLLYSSFEDELPFRRRRNCKIIMI